MSDDRSNDAVRRVLRLLGEGLEDWLEGDERALDALAERLDEADASYDDLQAACLVLKTLGREGAGSPRAAVEGVPGPGALRVPSAEEREAFSPEAWGYLLSLRSRGSLTSGQLESVLERLGESDVRPVDVAQAREVATRVALQTEHPGTGEHDAHGELELPH